MATVNVWPHISSWYGCVSGFGNDCERRQQKMKFAFLRQHNLVIPIIIERQTYKDCDYEIWLRDFVIALVQGSGTYHQVMDGQIKKMFWSW